MKREAILVLTLSILIFLASMISAARMPVVGGDSDAWGNVLNAYLNTSMNDSGGLRDDTVYSSQITDGTITEADISDITNLTLGQKITFALGGVVDNLVNGIINVLGNLRVEGQGNFSGTIFINNGTDITLFNDTAINTTAQLALAINTTAQLGVAVNTTAQQGLTINSTLNIGTIYNATASMIANTTFLQNFTLSSIGSFYNTTAGIIANKTFLTNFTLSSIGSFYNATSLIFAQMNNNTNTLQILLNSTGIYSLPLTINTTLNIQTLLIGTNISQFAFNQTLETFNAYNSTWDNSWVNPYNNTWYNHTLSTYNTYNDAWLSTYNVTYNNYPNILNETLLALSINSTLNIQNLLNSTGIYSTPLTINTTLNMQVLYNSTALLIVQMVNTTANIQNLLNGTGIYSTPLTINTTLNIQVLYNSTSLIFAQMNNNTATLQMLLNSTGIYSLPLTINSTMNIQNLINNTQGWTLNFSKLYINGTQVLGVGVPPNAIMAFNQATCPTGWVLADGTSGTPDLRGIFLRGSGTSGILNYSNGSLGRFSATYGLYKNDSLQGHNHIISYAYDTINSANAVVVGGGGATGPIVYAATLSTDGINGVPRTGAETNPAYYATIYCVKTAEDTSVSNSIWGESGNNIILQNTSKNLIINNTNFFINTTSGKVGIGTTSPGVKLHIQTSGTMPSLGAFVADQDNMGIDSNQAYNFITFRGNTTQAQGLIFGDSTRGVGNIVYYNGGTYVDLMSFATNGTNDRMVINGAGNVGIGTASPTYMLDVNSWMRGVALKVQSSGSDANRYSVYWNSVAGDMIFVSSDTKFKKDFDYNISGMETINLLKPLYFSYKENNFNEAGFLAEEVYNVNPNLAWYSAEKDEHGLNGPMGFIAVLVKAVQEQNLVIADLKKRIETLEQQNSDLKKALCEIKPELEICK